MTGSRTRRALLRTGVLGIVGFAGCIGTPDSANGDATETTTRVPTETSNRTTDATTNDQTASEATNEQTPDEATQTTADAAAVEIVPTSVQSSVLYLTTPDSMDVAAVEGKQFAFVEVTPQSDALPSPEDFALVADGRAYRATTMPGEVYDVTTLDEFGHAYDPDHGRAGWLAFVVPDPLDAEEVVVSFDGHDQSVSDEFLADLRAPPADFELVSFDAPDSVTHEESFDVTCTVENRGPGDGTFRACLNQAGPMYIPHRAAFPVAAGERRKWLWSFGQHVYEETERVTLRFRSPVGDRDVTVEVDSGETTSTG